MGMRLVMSYVTVVVVVVLGPSPLASASPVLTHPTGTQINPGGSGIKFKATNLVPTTRTSTSGSVLVECSTTTMMGTITRNSGVEIEAIIEAFTLGGTATGGKCTGLGGVQFTTSVGNGVPWCIRATNAMNANEFQIRGGKCSEAARSITFQMDTGLGVNCRYERGATSPVKGTFTTASTGDAILTVTGAGTTGGEDSEFTKEVGDSVLCPSSVTYDMDLTFETDTGSAEPLYIS